MQERYSGNTAIKTPVNHCTHATSVATEKTKVIDLRKQK